MFMRDEDLPTCKFSKLGDPTGGGRFGGGNLNTFVSCRLYSISINYLNL